LKENTWIATVSDSARDATKLSYRLSKAVGRFRI
jgi:hypothetical protein